MSQSYEKSRSVLGYRLLHSPTNKQFLINSFLRSPCSIFLHRFNSKIIFDVMPSPTFSKLDRKKSVNLSAMLGGRGVLLKKCPNLNLGTLKTHGEGLPIFK